MNPLRLPAATSWLSCALLFVSAIAVAASQAAQPAWIAKSNASARLLLDVNRANQIRNARDTTPPRDPVRYRAELADAQVELKKRLVTETDLEVRRDLALMIEYAQRRIDHLVWMDGHPRLNFTNLGADLFSAQNLLLGESVGAAPKTDEALRGLRLFAGLETGATAAVDVARARYEAIVKAPSTPLPPTKSEVERVLADSGRYLDGVRQLHTKHKLEGGDAAFAALQRQFIEYEQWTRNIVLPSARPDARVPREHYVHSLRQAGIDASPEELIRLGQIAFSETRLIGNRILSWRGLRGG